MTTAAQQAPAPAAGAISSRSTIAVTYEARRTTKVDLVGTPLMPRARGEAEIETEAAGPVQIRAKVRDVTPPAPLGPEYLTYVLWAVPPQGRAKNLGELRLDDGTAEIEATSDVQTFALIVTAEPYYAVTTPSDVVVIENARPPGDARPHLLATLQLRDRAARRLRRRRAASATRRRATSRDEPPDVQQARNAVAIAQIAQAARYAPDGLATAQRLLAQVEQLVARDGIDSATSMSQARASVQAAEEARLQSVGRRAAEAAGGGTGGSGRAGTGGTRGGGAGAGGARGRADRGARSGPSGSASRPSLRRRTPRGSRSAPSRHAARPRRAGPGRRRRRARRRRCAPRPNRTRSRFAPRCCSSSAPSSTPATPRAG